ncbi:MAG: hypothetical protein Q8S21_06095 [Candidatus Paracaedibacteraceae bacterium]|nr:hypothetical protein [Candidatus Paracaedibacteraceae bacterium]
MIHTFKYLCFFFVALLFQSDSAPIHQPEEGFRWRQNLGLHYQGQKIIDLDCEDVVTEHQGMSDFENIISHTLTKTEIDRNVALVRISVIFQDASTGILHRISDWIKWQGINEGISNQLAVFISGTGPFLSAERKSFLEGELEGQIHEITARELNQGISFDLQAELKQLFNAGLKQNLDESERIEKLREINAHDSQFHVNYHHSEQWVLNYLAGVHSDGKMTLMKAVDNLISTNRANGNFKEGAKILSVILHIHSKNDVCERCTQTISRIMAECNFLISGLKMYIQSAYNNNATISPTFLTLTSSRVNYKKRRDLHGHDDSSNDPIDLKALPPLFVQSVTIDSPMPQSDLNQLPNLLVSR